MNIDSTRDIINQKLPIALHGSFLINYVRGCSFFFSRVFVPWRGHCFSIDKTRAGMFPNELQKWLRGTAVTWPVRPDFRRRGRERCVPRTTAPLRRPLYEPRRGLFWPTSRPSLLTQGPAPCPETVPHRLLSAPGFAVRRKSFGPRRGHCLKLDMYRTGMGRGVWTEIRFWGDVKMSRVTPVCACDSVFPTRCLQK